MAKKNTADKSVLDNVKILSATITSNEPTQGDSKQRTINLQGGFSECNINESIFSDTVKVSYIFVESAAFDDTGAITVKEDLPINTTEDFEVKIKDDNGNVLQMNLNVNEHVTISETANNATILLKCVSEEFLTNEVVVVRGSYKGEISKSIERILKDTMKSKKNFVMKKNEKSQKLRFNGNNNKPFYTINWASKRDTPDKNKPVGGFLLFETTNSKGGQFNYVSIDSLFTQESKKKFIYNENPTIPEGFNGKILDVGLSDSTKSALQRLRSGAYITKTVTFDPSNKKYVEEFHLHNPDLKDIAAKRLPTFNKKFQKPTATTYILKDTGVLPEGNTKEQIQNSEKQNFSETDIANQARARYNQIQSHMITVTISGDFTLHAGDCIYVDSASFKSIDRPNTFVGGKYLIIDLCHHLSSKGCFTKMNLSRDSSGRKAQFTRVLSPLEEQTGTGDDAFFFTTP